MINFKKLIVGEESSLDCADWANIENGQYAVRTIPRTPQVGLNRFAFALRQSFFTAQ